MDRPKHVYTVPFPSPIPINRDMYWHLITGVIPIQGIAGGISRTLTSPLERLKILRQCSSKEYSGLSFLQAMQKFQHLEGIKGYFRGNGSNIVRIVPFSALEFFTFEQAKNYLLPSDNPRHKGWLLVCGSLSGIVASFVTYPLDLVRTILSIKVDKASTGIVAETISIVRAEGALGLYRGLNMTLMVLIMQGIAPFIGIKMTTFDLLKAQYMTNSNDKNFGKVNMLLGGTAGAVATAITYPTDLLRRKMQLIVRLT